MYANDCDEVMKDEIMGKFEYIQRNPGIIVFLKLLLS